MAQIVLGMACSHGPMLVTPPDQWGQRVEADRLNRTHFYRGNTYTFDELAALRVDENLAQEITQEIWNSRYAACRAAISKLADIIDEVKPDAAVIVGNDQKEMFDEACNPAFAIYTGSKIENRMGLEEHRANLEPGVAVAQPGRIPPEGATYDGLPDLGNFLAGQLTLAGFDIATVTRLRTGRAAIPHAFGFVYRQMMRDRVIPNVPIMINTFYPPNQPNVERCYAFGQALRKAVESWPQDQRVALIASGGLTHFVIDREVDDALMHCLRDQSIARLARFDETIFQSGTSEIKNWIPVAAAMAGVELTLNIVDYVPCYRSMAGTGSAMGFAFWR